MRFFIKDKIQKGHIEVEHCPPEKIWSDILNKPNQGKSFRIFRGELMNVPEDYYDEVEQSNTHPELLAKEEKVVSISDVLSQIMQNMINERGSPHIQHRSVL